MTGRQRGVFLIIVSFVGSQIPCERFNDYYKAPACEVAIGVDDPAEITNELKTYLGPMRAMSALGIASFAFADAWLFFSMLWVRCLCGNKSWIPEERLAGDELLFYRIRYAPLFLSVLLSLVSVHAMFGMCEGPIAQATASAGPYPTCLNAKVNSDDGEPVVPPPADDWPSCGDVDWLVVLVLLWAAPLGAGLHHWIDTTIRNVHSLCIGGYFDEGGSAGALQLPIERYDVSRADPDV